MPTYMIMKRIGEGELDLKVCAVIRGKSAGEIDDAIPEGATDGEGIYVAVSLGGVTERRLQMAPELTDPVKEEPVA